MFYTVIFIIYSNNDISMNQDSVSTAFIDILLADVSLTQFKINLNTDGTQMFYFAITKLTLLSKICC